MSLSTTSPGVPLQPVGGGSVALVGDVFGPVDRDRIDVQFVGVDAGIEPLTWGEKSILQDMHSSGSQFTMGGRLDLAEGSTVPDAAARLAGLVGRHGALRMRLTSDSLGPLTQEVAATGRLGLDVLTLPADAAPADVARYTAELMENWPLERFDFHHEWPIRMAVIRHRGACLSLVWALSHLAADGGAHVLLLDDLLVGGVNGREGRQAQLLDVARAEREPQLRQLSSRAMRYWEAQLRHIPRQTFGPPTRPLDHEGKRYSQVRFTSSAAHLAMLAIARRTATDASRVTLAIIATALARATGFNPLTIKVVVNNRFRPGMADVIAPIAQNSVVTIDVGDTTIDDVVARARGATLTAAMRAYYDPYELAEVMARLDSERGYPATITCRVNDQRAMVMRAEDQAVTGEVTPQLLARSMDQTTLTWLAPREDMHEQANILIQSRPGAVSLHVIWDRWSLTDAQLAAVLRSVEEVAVEAAFDATAPTGVPAAERAT